MSYINRLFLSLQKMKNKKEPWPVRSILNWFLTIFGITAITLLIIFTYIISTK